MRTSRIVRVIALTALVAPATLIATGGGGTWKERHQLVISPSPGVSADPERYAAAEVIWTSRFVLDECSAPECEAHGYLLDVIPFHTENGSDNCTQNGCPRLLCPDTTPFYAQPTPEHHCSGVLVGEDLILTAGHCAAPFAEDCTDQRFIFDYAVKYPGDSLGDAVSFPEDQVFVPFEDVFSCLEVRGFETPFALDTDPDEAFELFDNLAPEPDWAVMRMTDPVGPERVPLPVERVAETGVGTQALILGHPARIPLKTEVQGIDVRTEVSVGAPFTVLKGNSGSGMISLGTGKVTGVTVSGAPPLVCSEVCNETCPDPDGFLDICFACDNGASATPTTRFAGSVPRIGLQVTPALEVHHYGPATAPDHFPWKQFLLSVPAPPPGEYPSRDVDWTLAHEGIMVMLDVSGPLSGHLEPGDPPTAVSVKPLQQLLSGPGLWTALTAFFDQAYGTRTPMKHQIHVGLDGFALTPATDMVGEGPGELVYQGVHPRKTYQSTNRWIVDQAVTVERDPSWIRVNGEPGPTDVTLELGPGEREAATIELNADLTNLAPDVYSVDVIWRSEQSGNPEHEEDDVRTIRMDLCRDIYAGAPTSVTLQSQETVSLPVLVTAPPVYTVKDVDATVHLMSKGGGQHAGLRIALFHPQRGEAELKDRITSIATIFDDDVEELQPNEPLTLFNQAPVSRVWEFRVTNGGSAAAELTVSRIEGAAARQ